MKREEFVPTKHSRICGDHFVTSDYYPSSRMLLKTSVPSVFQFPQHLQKVVIERRLLKRKAPHAEDKTAIHVDEGPSVVKNMKLSPSKDELKDRIKKQNKEIKTLKQKVRRQRKKIDSSVITDMKDKALIDDKTFLKLNDSFSGVTLDMIANQIHNQDRDPRGRRYSDEVKKFALTLNFYSPRA